MTFCLLQYHLPLETLSDFLTARGSHFTLWVQGASSYESYFSSAPADSVRGKIWKEVIGDNLVTSNAEGFRKIMDEPRF